MTRPFSINLLRWRHNRCDSVSNHQPHHCLLKRLFRRRSKKTSKLRVTGLCAGTSPVACEPPHKGPVTRKCFHLVTSSCFRAIGRLQSYRHREGFTRNVSPCRFVNCIALRVPMTHIDGMTWKCFSHYWPFVRGNHRTPDGLLSQKTSNAELVICPRGFPYQAV